MIAGAVLFDAAGTTPVRQLPSIEGLQWLDDIDAEGSFGFKIPVEDGNDIEVGSTIKIYLGDRSDDFVFAGTVENIKIERTGPTSNGVARTYDISGRGIRGRLEDALIFPIGSETTRAVTGVSAGAAFRTFFNEAQTRGALANFTVDFTNSTDSYGAAFTTTITEDERVGTTLLELAAKHQELAVDVWVEPDLTIRYANERGVDRTLGPSAVILRVGQSISDMSQEAAGPIKNTVLIASGATGSTFSTRADAGSQANYGRRESFLSLANTEDGTYVQLAGDRLLNSTATPSDGLTIQLSDDGPIPYINYGIGDWVIVIDEQGQRSNYRIRAITAKQETDGGLTFVPELGTIRANLDKRLNRALNRIEKGNAAGETEVGYQPDFGIGGGLETCTVNSYDPVTRSGNADCSGISTDFDNTSPWTFVDGDEILIGTDNEGNHYGVGLSDFAAGGGPGTGGTQFGFVPPYTVGGLPYTPSIEISDFQSAGDGFIISGGQVIDFVTPVTFSIPVPTGFTGGLNNGFGFTASASGTFVFRRFTASTSNSLCVITNGVATIHNYGNVTLLGRSGGSIYALATHKNGTSAPRVITISSTGTVADFSPTFNRPGGGTTSLSVAAAAAGGAGPWGVCWRTDTTPTRLQVLANGATTGDDYDISSLASNTAMAIDSTYIYALSSSAINRTWVKITAATGVNVRYTDALPIGADGSTIARYASTQRVAIAGTYDDGTGAVPAIFTTDGTGVTTTTYPDAESIELYSTPTGTILGVKRFASPAGEINDQVIGIAL